jgi:8-oxo-dGTP pyrophosphatase MutT (NUDIX family)
MEKHIVAITALVMGEGYRFLIVKRKRTEIAYPGKWAFPGGKMERGESVASALAREIREEAGIEIDGWKRYLKDYTFTRPDGHNVVGLAFLVRANGMEVTLSEDFDEFRWITPGEIADYDCIPGMEEEVRIAYGQ